MPNETRASRSAGPGPPAVPDAAAELPDGVPAYWASYFATSVEKTLAVVERLGGAVFKLRSA